MKSSPGSPSILCVDDEPELVELTADFLSQHDENFSVITATSAREGLEALDDSAFDCVVSDYEMPGMDGIEFLEAVRAEYPGLPFLLFTGNGGEDVISEAFRAGATDHVKKGRGTVQYTILGQRIANAVQRYWATQRASDLGRIRALSGYEDVTGRGHRERKLTALHDVAAALETGASMEFICERTVEASQDILAFDLSLIDIEESGTLSMVALSEDILEDDTKEMSIDEGIAGKTYRTGKSILVDDIEAHPDASPQGPFRSGLSVPIGDHGVFQAMANEPAAFNEQDLELAELLISHTESALDRLDHEREVERQYERLEEFTSIVSHDLRNPLNVAQGRLELVRQEHESDHLEVALRAHERMEALISDLLTLAREGDRTLSIDSLSLPTVVNRCWRNVETEAASLEVHTDRCVHADSNQLQQLLENLIRNGVEHGGSDVTITVGDLETGFYVADDGIGIPADDRSDVFDLGYSTSDEGTGFGLGIVERVVEAHGWEISVTDSDDGGARFEVTGVTTDSQPTSFTD